VTLSPQELDELPAPTACPFCHSPKIMTTSDKVTTSSYWRCETCGEMWNVSRLRASSRFNNGRRWTS